ncbi:DNA-binding transcriptional regulator, AcrR family [Pseudomonas chlororaphis]|jgi:AcrR family transcriptional regulator|uniref:TetR/AcrR family transcriptional regulator n=1 Tax=Pseudomonas chlororaphis subsp. aurantiaca TaxID=86192 RepID=A0AAJ1E5K9_9PSED|nr:TetR/AcrR family transcriptional regulator [Pseudomonas chlororaphis]AZD46832.1 Transcriptional regulator, AcrR family [Pseudomonas chlororaphis subsp. aurantiaca]AZD65300.1 Transcriptional regulator, AcrR family [Pseudomonas chlororaphis subsp. aurantiaca]AZD71774.1 Transcriptional regulator, AcrR family [Pseudomonas chlororaphis subsp. aurantiaca]AZD77978.1 Transcriptional regulator, AcrR family [Pseudomonas chlororaphis subsp. aurantiaca]MBU4637009.1 TetR/AcrR family transcriptional regu
MARPKSVDKRNAILSAAIEVFAEQGLASPALKIAKAAGVAEGTLFNYFATKDDLLNQLYLDLKSELRDVMMPDYPRGETVKKRLHHVWQAYIDWGVAEPQKRKVMTLLGLSGQVTEQSKLRGMQDFAEVNALIRESMVSEMFRAEPPAFVAAILGAMADTTVDFIIREPAQKEQYSEAGFEALWNAIARK